MIYSIKICYNIIGDNMIQKGIDERAVVLNSQINRKSGNGSSFNYELEPLITNFSFYDFVDEAHKYFDDETQDHGAFIVITDKQYIIGYNGGFGAGTHLCSFGRVYKDINGGGNINMHNDGIRLSERCENKFITARIVYEKTSSGYSGYIKFKFPENRVTPSKLEVFKKFVEDYGQEIDSVCRKYNIVIECFNIENGIMYTTKVSSIVEVLELVSGITKTNAQITSNDDECIIGIEVKKVSNHI